MAQLRFALVGNPNCGKTSLFNRLTGANAKVANYPGVTVERRTGSIQALSFPAEVLDLPGTYSLFTTSLDEQVTRQVLLGEMQQEARPDALIAVVDATNLRLGLRLVLELKTLNRPMVLVLNQMDTAQARGLRINTESLSQALDMPVVSTVAIKRQGITPLLEALETFKTLAKGCQVLNLAPATETRVEDRYQAVEQLMQQHIQQQAQVPAWQDRLDAWAMHPILGWVFLFTLLLVVFQAVFAWAEPPKALIEAAVEGLSSFLSAHLPDGLLKGFLLEGLIAGVGGVLVFLPQILVLFFFILVLEDSGYLARAAFLLDKPMRGIGLSGRAFIPLLSSFACAVPGVMATRTIQDPKERFISIMVAPLMTCSARLPVYALIIGAFIPSQTVWGIFNLQGLTLFSLYLAGVISAAVIAWLLRLRISKDTYPLLLELPNYRWPQAYQVLIGLRERLSIFLKRVGTIILALTILVWFLCTYPAAPLDATAPAIEYSFAGLIGKAIAPIFAPLGFTWQMCIALIPAMAAREIAVSTLATVYTIGADATETALGATLAQDWPLAVAFAYLAWFIYAPQCISTLAVVKRETNSIKTTAFFTAYLFALAYFVAWLTYRITLLFTAH